MANTQFGLKFGWHQEKNSLVEEKELGVFNKNVTPLLLFIHPALLNSFCCIFQPPFIKIPCLFGAEESFFYERSVIYYGLSSIMTIHL